MKEQAERWLDLRVNVVAPEGGVVKACPRTGRVIEVGFAEEDKDEWNYDSAGGWLECD